MMDRWFKHLAAVAALAFVAACGGSDDDDSPPPGTVVEQAQRDSRLSILAEAVVAADLAGTLSGPGPYTVFAPTDAAFGALLTELGLTKAQLLADKPLLSAVLTYHVVPGTVPSSQVPAGKAITTVEGGIFKVDRVGSDLEVTDGRNRVAEVTAADLPATNGVIHVVDKVLLPADKTIVQTAQALPDFSILVEAVVAAGLVDALNATGPFTVFAPSNAAFADLLAELGLTKEQLLADTALLTRVLTYHVVDGRVLKADVPVGTPISTLQGDTLSIGSDLSITDQRARVSSIVATDVLAGNGVIHAINKVLLPSP
jgi:uncharacterized surface protein with fasciclin (FAS1) repeats